MADTGWLNFSEEGENYYDWTNPTYAMYDDSNYASMADGDQHDFYDFGANIPAGATITNLTISIKARNIDAEVPYFYVQFWKSGDFSSSKSVGPYVSETYDDISDDPEGWGISDWTVDDFNDEYFGVIVAAAGTSGLDFGAYVNHIRIKIEYTESSSSSSSTSISVTKSSASSQSSVSSLSSESSNSVSVSQTKTSSSVSISVTKSSASSQSSVSSLSSSSISETKSLSSESVSVTKSSTSSSISIEAETDWLNPTATGDTCNEWDNPANAYLPDANYASMELECQDYYNFNIPVPKYSNILGIAVKLQARRYNDESPDYNLKLSWNGGISWTATKATGSYLNTTAYYKQLGGALDTWGRSWSVSELSNANFLVWVDQVQTDVLAPYVNHICLRVYYEATSSTSISSASITKSSGSSQSSVSSLSSISISQTKSSGSSQSSVISFSSISISQTKTSSSTSISQTKSSASSESISATKSSCSSSVSGSKTSSSISISQTKSSSSESVSLTKSSSSVSLSVTKSSASSSESKDSKSSTSDSVSISVTKSSASSSSKSVSQTKSSSSLSVSWTLSSSSISVSVTSSSLSCSSFSATKSSLSSLSSSATKSSASSSFSQFDIGRTILKLAWGTRIVNFSHLEVNTVQIGTFKKLDLQRLQNRQPVVYELGASWKIIDVILDGYMSAMTMSKLEAIRKVTSIMTMTLYYSDRTTQAEQYSVRIDPGAKSYYLAGNRSAQDQLGVVFYEAQSA